MKDLQKYTNMFKIEISDRCLQIDPDNGDPLIHSYPYYRTQVRPLTATEHAQEILKKGGK